MVQEDPGKIEASPQVLRQRLDAHRLGRVVTCIKDVQAQLLGVEERVVRSLTGDE